MFDLKESDLPELKNLKSIGVKWVARDRSDRLCAFKDKPQKGSYYWVGALVDDIWRDNALSCVSWSDEEPLNIADAIAQIKAQSHAKAHGAPLTWNERLGQMTVEEKAENADSQGLCVAEVFDGLCQTPARGGSECLSMTCRECWECVLTSPCEGGEKE